MLELALSQFTLVLLALYGILGLFVGAAALHYLAVLALQDLQLRLEVEDALVLQFQHLVMRISVAGEQSFLVQRQLLLQVGFAILELLHFSLEEFVLFEERGVLLFERDAFSL